MGTDRIVAKKFWAADQRSSCHADCAWIVCRRIRFGVFGILWHFGNSHPCGARCPCFQV